MLPIYTKETKYYSIYRADIRYVRKGLMTDELI